MCRCCGTEDCGQVCDALLLRETLIQVQRSFVVGYKIIYVVSIFLSALCIDLFLLLHLCLILNDLFEAIGVSS